MQHLFHVEYSKLYTRCQGGSKMLRKIIHIDADACNGCGRCVDACHEGAIALVNGKAKLVKDEYCDGLGDCLPSCPKQAIRFTMRDTLAYDEEAVQQHMQARQASNCPGRIAQRIVPHQSEHGASATAKGALGTWPIQMQLLPLQALYYQSATLLIAADCTAFAYGNFHQTFVQGNVVAIGCPKLDRVDYSEKIAEIIRLNALCAVRVVRMEVPCCKGLTHAIQHAIQKSGKQLPYSETIITTNGHIT